MQTEASNTHIHSIFVGAATHTGRVRDHNEDAWRAPLPGALVARDVAEKGVLLVVCDGVGGLQAGEVASSTAVNAAFNAYYADPDANRAEALQRAVQVAHEAVRQTRSLSDVRVNTASTIVMAVIHNGQVCVANVGDSRCYLLRAGHLTQLSTDHSWVHAQVKAGVLRADEARSSAYQNVLTRILGGNNPQIEADVAYADWIAGDKLLLCSDGVWNMVPDETIARILTDAGASAQQAADALVRAANEAGGTDNITCVVAFDPSQSTAVIRARRPVWAVPLAIGLAAVAVFAAVGVISQLSQRPSANNAVAAFTPGVSFVTLPATPTRLPQATEFVSATVGTAVGTPTPAPQATATVQARPIQFCRLPKDGRCAKSEPKFVLKTASAREVDAVAVWFLEDLRGANRITMQWIVNDKNRLIETCTITNVRCEEQGVSPTRSSIPTTELGAYRLDVIIEGQTEPVLTGSFIVVGSL